MILEKIKKQQLQARKEKSPIVGALTALMSEVAIVGKNNGNRETTDEEAVKVIKKFIKGINETIDLIKDPEKLKLLETELEIYNSFLPQIMNALETRAAVEKIINALPEKSPKAMGQVMGAISKEYGILIDRGLASQIVKEMLKKKKKK